jgi:hypothetical protein
MPKPRPKSPAWRKAGSHDVGIWPVPNSPLTVALCSYLRYCKEAGAESNSTLSPSAVPFGRGWKKKSDVT